MANRECEPRNFQTQVKRVNADNTIIPHLKNNESFPITIAPFRDHGRPSFISSTIKSHPVFLEIARGLTPSESKRTNDRLAMEIELTLDRDETRRNPVLSSPGKPDVHVVSIGESYNPNSLRLYYTRGEVNGTPVLYQQAIARLRDATRVERVFIEVGYKGGKNWEKRRVH